MSKSNKKPNHNADIKNKNIGTDGVNVTISKVHGNRSKQLQKNKKR